MTPSERRKVRTRDWVLIAVLVAMLIVAGVATMSALSAIGANQKTDRLARENARLVAQVAKTIKRIEKVRLDARDESCLRSEQQEEAQALRVIRTYDYLDAVKPGPPNDITKAVLRALPDTYQAAKAAKAPSYCNAPGVGLPEQGERGPNGRLRMNVPVLPKRRSFKQLSK